MTSILIVEDDITYGMMLKTWLGKGKCFCLILVYLQT